MKFRSFSVLATALIAAATLFSVAQNALAQEAPRVKFATTAGDFVVEVYPDKAPKTVDNFLQYVKDKHYDGTLFHRVMGDFMAQGGDPKSRELGCEFAGQGTSAIEIEMEMDARHGFWRGAVGFAHKWGNEQNGCQFFLTTALRTFRLQRQHHVTRFSGCV